MKNIQILLSVAFIIGVASCRKDSPVPGVVSLNLVHATANLDDIAVSFTATPVPFYQNQSLISFGSTYEYGLEPGDHSVSILSARDTSKIAWSGILALQQGKMYSLYLAGQAGRIDTLFQQDLIPFYTDSSAGIRFVNLFSDGKPVSISIAGNSPSQKEFSNLGYKQVSSFKSYSAGTNTGGVYNFEVRDQLSDSLLSTFSWYYSLQKCNTIVISGSTATGFNLFQVNNY